MKRLSLYGLHVLAIACAPLHAADCKPVHAGMIESRTSSGCNPPLTACFIGRVEGDHGLRGTTHFAADSSIAESPKTSPGFIIYSGPFEYRMPTGTLITRETGVSNGTTGQPSSGAVTAHQQIVEGTGSFAGATGHFFVSGHRANGTVTTRLSGELCLP